MLCRKFVFLSITTETCTIELGTNKVFVIELFHIVKLDRYCVWDNKHDCFWWIVGECYLSCCFGFLFGMCCWASSYNKFELCEFLVGQNLVLMLLITRARCIFYPIELCPDTVYIVELCYAAKFDRYSGSYREFGCLCCSAGLNSLRCWARGWHCLHCWSLWRCFIYN